MIIRLEDELETDTLKYILETENTYVLAVTPVETRNILRIYLSIIGASCSIALRRLLQPEA